MLGTYFVVALLGLLTVGLVGWVVAGVVGERRKARVAERWTARFQRTGDEPPRGDRP